MSTDRSAQTGSKIVNGQVERPFRATTHSEEQAMSVRTMIEREVARSRGIDDSTAARQHEAEVTSGVYAAARLNGAGFGTEATPDGIAIDDGAGEIVGYAQDVAGLTEYAQVLCDREAGE